MKHSIFLFLLILLLTPTACQQEKAAGVDLDALKQTLNADPEFEATVNAFREHTYWLTQINGEELRAIHKKAHSCGFYASDAKIDALAECLKDHPKGDIYVEAQKFSREFEERRLRLEKRYPDLAQLSPIEKGKIYASGPDHAMRILSNRTKISNHEN